METVLNSKLRCPHCQNPLLDKGNVLVCKGCGASFEVNDGKVFFLPKSQVDAPDQERAVLRRDSKRWTPLRKKQYAFLSNVLEAEATSVEMLDIGCGPAQFDTLTTRFKQVTGIDFSPFTPVHVVHDINASLPFSDSSYDVALATNVLEHIPDSTRLLAETIRTLRPGGRLYGVIPFLLEVHQPPYDFHRYTPYMLRLLMEKAGFIDIAIFPTNNILETFVHQQNHYFKYMYGHMSPIMPLHKKVVIKLLVQFFKVLVSLLPKDAYVSDRYTLGYNFSAKKPEQRPS